jgi:hypothetical protein
MVKFRSREQQARDWAQMVRARDEMRKDDPTLPPLERPNPPPISDPPSRELLPLHAALCKVKRARGGADVYDAMREDDVDSCLPAVPRDDDLGLRLLDSMLLAFLYEKEFVFDRYPPLRLNPFEGILIPETEGRIYR